ncbi:MAG: hypothetical protein ABI672_05945 [Vicinamibacteria bacterium]
MGGIMVRRGNGPTEYIDPLGQIASTPDDGAAFNAVIMQESMQKTAKFGVVLGLIKSILPGSLDLGGGATSDVKLDQITATGRRLKDDEVKRLIASKETAAEITKDLGDGLTVWVIQEVYNAEELRVSASTQVGFDVKFAGGQTVQDCGPQPKTTPSAASTQEKKAEAKTASSPKAAQETDTSKKEEQKDPATATPPTQSASAEKISAGLSVCRSGSASLSFKSATAGERIPFAVRLKQIELPKGGQLSIKRGGVVPNVTLGPNSPEFALVNAQVPEIANLTRRKR